MKILINFFLLLFIGCNTAPNNENTNEHITSNHEYDIQDVVIKTRDGGTISAIVARKKGDKTKKPAILQYTIYVMDKGKDLETIKKSVDKGYVGVIAYTRGKRFSPDEIFPYEHDANDSYDVIDWVSKQDWCNGSVGMFGGSYNGFTQWAAAKKLHPALKTIVPYVANRPGMGLPRENGIFINPNYYWSLFVSNNKYLDIPVMNDRNRFRKMQNEWWASGVAFNTIDSIDGTPNRLFQRWLKHPSFDQYWQNMTPYQNEFAQINIPVLTIDGYYNDSQGSSLSYLKDHYNYNPNAEHYLIIGPYNHMGAQYNGAKTMNGYKVDKDALINTEEITYQWFEYIFKNGKKPNILKDKINYQVMGANEWRSAPSIDKMKNKTLKFFLSHEKFEDIHFLKIQKPTQQEFHYQEVDFSDRETWNNDNHPDPIIRDYRDMGNGFNFISEPLEESIIVNGAFIGELKVSINKKDFDFGVTLYELMPDGNYFNLSYINGRASYMKDISKRILLSPNTIETIPFSNTRLVSKKLSKGSKLLIHINVNKNPFFDLNYGTGKDVAEETIQDAKEPLKVKWYNDSYVEIPIWQD